MELLAVPLGLIPLAFASAIVRYRLMDVEVIVKRGLVYVAAALGRRGGVSRSCSALVGLDLRRAAPATTRSLPCSRRWCSCCSPGPLKDAVQNVLDRAFYRDRYDYRRALVGFARDLSTDLDLARLPSAW